MRELQINRVYRHFKGDYYLVIDVAYNSETKENMLFIERYMAIINYGLDLMICL